MNRIVKNVIAAALAVVFVAEAAPVTDSGLDFSGQYIVAEAAETKPITAGEKYYLGDTIDFGNGEVWVQDFSSSIPSNYAGCDLKIEHIIYSHSGGVSEYYVGNSKTIYSLSIRKFILRKFVRISAPEEQRFMTAFPN